jgi:hypothetical protein
MKICRELGCYSSHYKELHPTFLESSSAIVSILPYCTQRLQSYPIRRHSLRTTGGHSDSTLPETGGVISINSYLICSDCLFDDGIFRAYAKGQTTYWSFCPLSLTLLITLCNRYIDPVGLGEFYLFCFNASLCAFIIKLYIPISIDLTFCNGSGNFFSGYGSSK